MAWQRPSGARRFSTRKYERGLNGENVPRCGSSGRHARSPISKPFPNTVAATGVSKTPELVIPRLPYVVVYRIFEERLLILNIVHGAQRWPYPKPYRAPDAALNEPQRIRGFDR